MLGLILYVLIALVPPVALFVAVLVQLYQPLRRRERVQLMLDLIETGLTQGRTPEQTMVEVANLRGHALGHRLPRLAGCVQRGLRLSDALAQVRGILPPAVVATLKVGEQFGDIRPVLPICRAMGGELSAKAAAVQRYASAWPLLLSLGGAFIVWFLGLVILPKFREILLDLTEGAPLPLLTAWVFDHLSVSVVLTALPAAGVVALALSDSWLSRWLGRLTRPWADELAYRIPWRRWRLQRDFSAALAVMLDGGMPEAAAVTHAAQCTDNRVIITRAQQVVAQLREGAALTTALRALADAEELHWRLANAARGPTGFTAALAGWHAGLAAKAFQAEQAAAQLFITGLILLNGLAVGLIVVAVFRVLTTITTELALW